MLCLRVQGGCQVQCGDNKWRRLLLAGALGADILVPLHPHLQLAPAHLLQPASQKSSLGSQGDVESLREAFADIWHAWTAAALTKCRTASVMAHRDLE